MAKERTNAPEDLIKELISSALRGFEAGWVGHRQAGKKIKNTERAFLAARMRYREQLIVGYFDEKEEDRELETEVARPEPRTDAERFAAMSPEDRARYRAGEIDLYGKPL